MEKSLKIDRTKTRAAIVELLVKAQNMFTQLVTDENSSFLEEEKELQEGFEKHINECLSVLSTTVGRQLVEHDKQSCMSEVESILKVTED